MAVAINPINPAVAQLERSLAGGQGTRGRTHRRSLPPGLGGQIRLAAAQFLGRLSWQRALLRVPVAGTGTLERRFRPPRKCCSAVPQGQAGVEVAVGAKPPERRLIAGIAGGGCCGLLDQQSRP